MMRLDKELINLYRETSWLQRAHVILRYLLCPFSAVEKFIPREGKILDLGCGHGIFANVLAMKSSSRYVIGVDKDSGRIAVANSTLSGKKNLEFRQLDILGYSLDSDVNCAVLIDLPLETNQGLLTKLYAKLPSKGILVIKSMSSRRPGWKHCLNILHMATVDKLLRVSLRKNAYFLKEEDFVLLLEEIGFRVKFLNIDKGYPCPHCLYICNKD
ncbi:MAG: class I SAM-dependent methyltransferase [Candidatus Omnitrophica bacterium]|nr:class I SAM-dependent methyltransferase [Candidatus Omnitrophota bacterium]